MDSAITLYPGEKSPRVSVSIISSVTAKARSDNGTVTCRQDDSLFFLYPRGPLSKDRGPFLCAQKRGVRASR
jgi:hypothetical protein